MNVRRCFFIVIVIILGLSLHQLNFSAIISDPLLVCAIMIKNEAPVIEQTLKAMADGGIDSFLVYDTGSTDTTIAQVNKFFNEQNITNFAIEQEEFVDFETSRNRALDLVDKYFPDATFILMPDAEWILYGCPELIKFCQDHRYEDLPSYEIRLIMNDHCEFNVRRLLRKQSCARFKGVVHECLAYVPNSVTPETIYIKYNPTRFGADKSFKRFKRDIGLLLQEYSKHPEDPRTVFYIAQTYACLGDHENAIRFYEIRSKMNGSIEENFMTIFRLAQEIEELAAHDKTHESFYTWELAQYYYLKAFSMRSSRIEPLVRLASHYVNEGNNALAYLFATRTISIPYPHHDMLFIEKDMYTYSRYDILGRCAWYIDEFDKGEWALNEALKSYPDDEHLKSNLSFYLDRKQTLDQTVTTSAESYPFVLPDLRYHSQSEDYPQCNSSKDSRSLEGEIHHPIIQFKTQSHSLEDARLLHQLIRQIISKNGGFDGLAEYAAPGPRPVVGELDRLMTTTVEINISRN